MNRKLKIDLKNYEFVDLGLQSGTLWAKQNVIGLWSSYEAQEAVPNNLPTRDEFDELINQCKWSWDEMRSGCTITGPNGNTIFISGDGYKVRESVKGLGYWGNYWTSEVSDEIYAYKFRFTKTSSSRGIELANKTLGLSILLVKHGAVTPDTSEKKTEDDAAQVPSPSSSYDRKIKTAVKAVNHILEQRHESISAMCTATGVPYSEFKKWMEGQSLSDQSVVALSKYLNVPKALLTLRNTTSESSPAGITGKKITTAKPKMGTFALPKPDLPKEMMSHAYVPSIKEMRLMADNPHAKTIAKWIRENPGKGPDILQMDLGISDALLNKYYASASILAKLDEQGLSLPFGTIDTEVAEWKRKNPSGTKKLCAQDLSLTLNHVSQHWYCDKNYRDLFFNLESLYFRLTINMAKWLKANPDSKYPLYEYKRAVQDIRYAAIEKYLPLAESVLKAEREGKIRFCDSDEKFIDMERNITVSTKWGEPGRIEERNGTPGAETPSTNGAQEKPVLQQVENRNVLKALQEEIRACVNRLGDNGRKASTEEDEITSKLEKAAETLRLTSERIMKDYVDLDEKIETFTDILKISRNIIVGSCTNMMEQFKSQMNGILQTIGYPLAGTGQDDNPGNNLMTVNRHLILSGIDSKVIHVILAYKAIGEKMPDIKKIAKYTHIGDWTVRRIIRKYGELLEL